MKHCTQCGHLLGLGRFCTNCGHPVAVRHADPLSDPIDLGEAPAPTQEATPSGPDWRSDTAERPRRVSTALVGASEGIPLAAPREPPVVLAPPAPPRFPLYADELAATPAEPVTAGEPIPTPSTLEELPEAPDEESVTVWDDQEWDDQEWDDEQSRRRPRWVRFLAGAVVLVTLVAGAWFLGQLLGRDDAKPDTPSAGGPAPGADGPEVDHTAEASARAPETAPPNQDVDGQPTSYDASNMLDGVPTTAWRAAGDGSGFKLVFTFPDKTRISQVGLVNGYAKKAKDGSTVLDWYAGHRRIEQVTWNFGNGAVVRQDLDQVHSMQTIDVDPVQVRKVVLKIISTTPPGKGPASRDFTAISDVRFADLSA